MKPDKNTLMIEDIRKMTDEELRIEVENQRNRLFSARSQLVTEKVDDVSQFGKFKKNIARLLTEQSARRHAASGKSSGAGKVDAGAKGAAATAGKKTGGTKKGAAKAGAAGTGGGKGKKATAGAAR